MGVVIHADGRVVDDGGVMSQVLLGLLQVDAWQAQVLRERIRNLPGPAAAGVSRAREPRRTES